MRRWLVAATTIAIVVALTTAPTSTQAKVRNDGRLPVAPPEVVGDAPRTVVAIGPDGQGVASRTFSFNPQGPLWTCAYLAVKGVGGSTPEVGLDILRGPMDPSAGELVALSCYTAGALAHQEIMSFEPSLPFGRLDVAADARGLAGAVALHVPDAGPIDGDAAPSSPPPPAP